MKIFVASDIHGSYYFASKMVDAYKKEKCDYMLLLGDILYHGPRNDLPLEYNPKQVINLLNNYKDEIICVRGNCDAEVDQMVLEFNIMNDYVIINNGTRKLFATHGHIFNKDNLPYIAQNCILLHGHTHIPIIENEEKCIYMNPGSVSIPKLSSKHSYMVIEDNKYMWKDLLDNTVYANFEDIQ